MSICNAKMQGCPSVSVIVTVHNSERYLRECLDSVMNQTFTNIEVLCMDGGSTDASPRILQEYAGRDKRFHIINDPDTSYGHKVNEGIRLAKASYVSVLESDDMYETDMLEKLTAIIETYDPDYVNADYLEFQDMNGKRFYRTVSMYPEQDYNYLIQCGRHPENMRQILRYWTGIFKKEFLVCKNIRMNESPGASFQDMSFRFLTSALADTCYHLDETVYLYRTDNPASSVYDPEKAVIIADEFEFLKKELVQRKIDEPAIWEHFYTWKYNDFYGNMIRFKGEARNVLYRRCMAEIQKDREYLDRHNGRCFSGIIQNLLEKPEKIFLMDIEKKYQILQENIWLREMLYRKPGEGRIVISGCGVRCRELLLTLASFRKRICCLTDNESSLWNTKLDGYMIESPVEAVKKYPDAYYVVTSKMNAAEMKFQLCQMGIPEVQIITVKDREDET